MGCFWGFLIFLEVAMKAPTLALAGVCLCFSSSVYAWYSPPWNSKGVDAHVSVPINKPDRNTGSTEQDRFKQQIGRINTGVSIYPKAYKKVSGYTQIRLGDFFSSFGSQAVINLNW